MPMKFNLMMPTGYEQQEKSAASKRKIAQAMMEQGLAPQANMQNWTQVLGKFAQTWAGKSVDKEANKIEADVAERKKADYAMRSQQFYADTKAMPLEALIQKHGSDPMMQDIAKPYLEAFAGQLKDRNKMVTWGGRNVRQGSIPEGAYEPGKPTDGVLQTPDGRFVTNDAASAGALIRQGWKMPDGSRSFSMPNPYGGGNAAPQPMPQMQPPAQPLPGDPLAPQSDALDLSLFSAEEQSTMRQEMARRVAARGAGGGGSPYYPPNPNTPMGSPLAAARAPAGLTVDGQPFWMINGVAYDNAEGK